MFFIGLSNGNLGRMSAALTVLEEAIKMAGRNGDQFWFPRMPNCIGWVHRELQDFDGALKYDQEGLQVGRQYHVLEAEANSLINLGIDHTQAGRPEETAAAFAEARDIFERDAWFRWRYNIRLEAATAAHWLRQKDLSQASTFAQRLAETAALYKAHKYVAEAHRLKARIALAAEDTVAAENEFQAALEELGHHPVPILEWRTHADLGRLKARNGNQDEAQKSFQLALETIKSCADNVNDENLRATFLNSKAVQAIVAGAGAGAQTDGQSA
jgi:tetratricopeptide (TPR) repeat protein